MSTTGRLLLVATPIGNLEDVSFRAVRVLGEVDALACEDTRTTHKLLQRHGIDKPPAVFSYHEHNEQHATDRIVALIRSGKNVALCSEAGSPGISDPGYRIVSRAVQEGIPVEVVPGPSAVTSALLCSGLPSSSFTFKGFAPKQKGKRLEFLRQEAQLPHTLVFFESPRRTGVLLVDALEVLGDRRAAVCIELTKKFERVSRGFLSELAEQYGDGVSRGEVTVVVAGNHPKFIRGPAPSLT